MEESMKTSAAIPKALNRKDIHKLVKAYNTIGDILFSVLDPADVYSAEFDEGLEQSLKEVSKKRTKPVKSFSDFIS